MSQRGAGSKWLIVAIVVLVLGAVLSQLYGVRVKAVLSHTGKNDIRCPIESPVQVVVTNYTFRRVARVSVQLEGWRNGRSDNILKGMGYDFPFVVGPFESREACYRDAAFDVSGTPTTKQSSTGRWLVDAGAVIEQVNRYGRLADGVELVVVDYHVTFR